LAEQGRRYVVPYFSDHVYAFSGALKAAGNQSRILPLPSESVRRMGEAHVSGKECHPYILLAGDLIAFAQSKRVGGEAFIFPGTTIPCLLHQYGDGHRHLLQRLGIDDLEVVTPVAWGLRELLGFDNAIRLWQGLVAIDLLIKATCEIRPYELESGMTDDIHQQNLQDIETATAAGELGAALALSTARLKMIPVDRSKQRPLVGVAGDLYTRINPAGNEDLFHWLEARGLEVWPAPFLVDVIDFSWRREIDVNLGQGRYAAAALSSILMLRKNLESWLVQRQLRGQVNRIQEPGYREVIEMASPYLGKLANEALILNVAKMVDFARRGADGVINAVCFNCMLGTISASITQRIRDDHQGIPIANLFYNRVEGSQRSVLEAFVHQVHARHHRQALNQQPPQRSRLMRLLGA
jgi:predicted nucleotide-binding protein (sugar kinase/HSP70/actin superfamily)